MSMHLKIHKQNDGEPIVEILSFWDVKVHLISVQTQVLFHSPLPRGMTPITYIMRKCPQEWFCCAWFIPCQWWYCTEQEKDGCFFLEVMRMYTSSSLCIRPTGHRNIQLAHSQALNVTIKTKATYARKMIINYVHSECVTCPDIISCVSSDNRFVPYSLGIWTYIFCLYS